MKQNISGLLMAVLSCLAICGCHKDALPVAPAGGVPVPPLSGLYILNAGLADTSSLSFYNLNSGLFTADKYNDVNGRALGKAGEDLAIYGSKMYIALTNSSVINIADAKTGRLIKQDSLINPVIGPPLYNYSRMPRAMTCYKGKVYISCFEGTIAVLDTLTQLIEPTSIYVKGTPEGLIAANNKLYITLPNGGVTNTVIVIDLATNQAVKTINVLPNPVGLTADNYGNVYVQSSWTDDWQYNNVSLGGMAIIDSKTDTLKATFTADQGNTPGPNLPIAVNGDLVYFSLNKKIAVYSARTKTLMSTSFVSDGTAIQWPSSICVNTVTGEVYITDAKESIYGYATGIVNIFDKTGRLEYSFSTAVNPVKVKLMQ